MFFSENLIFLRKYSSNTKCIYTRKDRSFSTLQLCPYWVFFCGCVMLSGSSRKKCFLYYRDHFQEHKKRFGPKTSFALEIRQKSWRAKLYISSVQGTFPENNSNEINYLCGRRERRKEKKSAGPITRQQLEIREKMQEAKLQISRFQIKNDCESFGSDQGFWR